MNIKKSVFVLIFLLLMLSLVQATKIEVSTTKETFSTGEDITLKVSLLDNENNPISDQVSILIEDAEKINKIEKNIQSNEFTDISIGKEVIGGYWSIKATYQGAESLGLFIIESEETAEFQLNKDILTIINTGNTRYTKTIQIIIGDNIEIKTPNLEIGEKVQYRLVAPSGNYNIEIKEEGVTKVTISEVQLTGTGQAIGALDERSVQRSGITGGITPDEDDDMALLSYMKKSSLIYIFILVVFGVAVLLAIQRKFTKKKE